MSDEIIKPDGTVYTPINLADHLGVSEEQLVSLREAAIQQSLSGLNIAIANQAEQWAALSDEISESIKAGKEDMICR